jgi:hypothetical protein
VDERCRRDLLGQRILRIRNPEAAPHMRGLLIDRQDRIRVSPGYLAQPSIQESRLFAIPTMPNALDALPQLTNGYLISQRRSLCSRRKSSSFPTLGIAASTAANGRRLVFPCYRFFWTRGAERVQYSSWL